MMMKLIELIGAIMGDTQLQLKLKMLGTLGNKTVKTEDITKNKCSNSFLV